MTFPQTKQKQQQQQSFPSIKEQCLHKYLIEEKLSLISGDILEERGSWQAF